MQVFNCIISHFRPQKPANDTNRVDAEAVYGKVIVSAAPRGAMLRSCN